MYQTASVGVASPEKVLGTDVFSKSRLTLQKWLLMMYLWTRDYPVSDASEEAKIDIEIAIDIFQCFREVYSTKFMQTPIVLGGEGVVQIDESLFRHKPKVCTFKL